MLTRLLRNSLSRKLMALFFAVFFISVCGLTYFAYTSSRDSMLQEFKIRGRTLAKAIASEARTYYDGQDVEGLTSLLQSLGEGEDVVAILAYQASKTPWIEYSGIELTVEDLDFPDIGNIWQRDLALRKGHNVSEFGNAVIGSLPRTRMDSLVSSPSAGWIRVFLDRRALERRLNELIARTLLVSALTTLAGGALFILLLRRSLHVIGPLTAATKRVAQGDLRQTVPLSSSDELGELASSFNSMTEQLVNTTVSKNYVDNIIRSMNDTLIVFNPEGTIRSANLATLNLLGYEESELVGRDASMIFPSNENPLHQDTYHDMLARGSINQTATTYRAKNGRTFPMLFSAAVIRNEDGALQGIACVAKDITDLKQAEEQLRLQGTALKSAANAVVITDRCGHITWVNPSFTALTGYSFEEAVGQGLRIQNSGRHDQPFYQNMWQTILAGKVWHGEIINRKKDGSLYTEEETITPVHDQNGVISHFIGIKQDVTERKQAEEAIQEANQKLKMLDQLRSNFFADISHELRTPLTVIRGEAEVTLRGKDKPVAEYKTTLDRIVTLTNQLNKLVSDLLFLARSESSTLEIGKQPVLLLEVLQEVHREAQVLAMRRGAVADLTAPPESFIVDGDPHRLQQLFMTLVDNSINYSTQGGTVEIRVSKSGNNVAVMIIDDGIGIPVEDLPHVFERFYRAKRQQRPTLHPGSGLGLPIAKWITEAHGGAISIASIVDRGTTVTVQLPLSTAEHNSNLSSPVRQEVRR
jgi:PAS domain S-box-containing protein